MRLRKAEDDLLALAEYMIVEHGAPESRLLKIRIKHDPEQDAVNAKDPRAFCFVEKKRPNVIHCAKAIDDLPPEARVGVLFHEIGHILLNAFHGDESEVDVDEWCVNFLPMANYTYLDTPYITSCLGINGGVVSKGRIAKSLQNVTPDFLHVLEYHKYA